MTYATAARYCEEFSYPEARTQLRDDQGLLTAELLRVAVAGTAWPAGTTPEAQAVATAAVERLVRKLGNVANIMDGYLRAAVTLPVPQSVELLGSLEECCLALARDELANDSGESTDLITKRADRWRLWLRDVAAKKVSLVQADGTVAESTGSGRVVTGQPGSAYNWAAFGAVR